MSKADVNSFLITGTLIEEPVVRQIGDGFVKAEIQISVNTPKWDSKTKRHVDNEEPIKLVAFGDQAESAAKYPVGSVILASGKLQGYAGTSKDGRDYVANSVQVQKIACIPGSKSKSAPEQELVQEEGVAPEDMPF